MSSKGNTYRDEFAGETCDPDKMDYAKNTVVQDFKMLLRCGIAHRSILFDANKWHVVNFLTHVAVVTSKTKT